MMIYLKNHIYIDDENIIGTKDQFVGNISHKSY